ncbi:MULTISPECIES: GNAT family N-acetyltransferase [unclassified Haladaptatus]|uniref:GNAT family N-acetyltransferase n=1 Tax=unclassified Haladaptatus TaxID=2622732 RepID=UPI0023E7909B|nr:MULTISPECIES: GNAT family N-acetyltransferase [unclassified Haladaptatus]
MTVRAAMPDDTEGILAVAQASWETDYPTILSRETVSAGVADWYDPATIRGELERTDTVMLVKTDDGAVEGFVHALWNHDEGDILRLYVHPDARRSGVGTALLQSAVNELFDRGVDLVRAMVLKDNNLGNSFYEDYGFSLESESETYIGGEPYPESVYVLHRH